MLVVVTPPLDAERCYRAVAGRDARFDGWFFTAVHTTGIYCRPSCPARTPLARNVSFFTTAAAAQDADFRACRRCRPDAAPGSPAWDVRAHVVARAMRPPALRRPSPAANGAAPGWLTLRLTARAPYAADEVLLFLGAHAVPGLEDWDGTTFSRVLDLPHGPALVQLSPDPDGG